jgi:predicted  nucleic acid-binding Zn-ribbon protein
MTTKNLLSRIKAMLKAPPGETELSKLKKTVKRLKARQKELEEKLEKTKGKQSRRSLQQKIDVLHAQRRKGAKLYRELKTKRD